ncbi:hypothetical protein TYRP_023450, partial [Tyrophagus putrescentiae]
DHHNLLRGKAARSASSCSKSNSWSDSKSSFSKRQVLISRRRTRRTALVATVEEVGGGGQRQRNDDGRPLDHLRSALMKKA